MQKIEEKKVPNVDFLSDLRNKRLNELKDEYDEDEPPFFLGVNDNP